MRIERSRIINQLEPLHSTIDTIMLKHLYLRTKFKSRRGSPMKCDEGEQGYEVAAALAGRAIEILFVRSLASSSSPSCLLSPLIVALIATLANVYREEYNVTDYYCAIGCTAAMESESVSRLLYLWGTVPGTDTLSCVRRASRDQVKGKKSKPEKIVQNVKFRGFKQKFEPRE